MCEKYCKTTDYVLYFFELLITCEPTAVWGDFLMKSSGFKSFNWIFLKSLFACLLFIPLVYP